MFGIFVVLIFHKHPFVIIKVRYNRYFHSKNERKLSLDSISDFSWRPNSDNLVSVGRDERVYHANISSAIKTDQFVSLFSLNVTSKGHTYAVMPNIDNDYICALYAERHVPLSYTNLKEVYSESIMSTFLKWNEPIRGKSIIGVYHNPAVDNSVELFHQFARRWTFGNGEKSSEALIDICDTNSHVAERLKRPDLTATWQVIKMIYANYNGVQTMRMRSSRNTPSATRNHLISESLSGQRHHHHHHHHHHHNHIQQNGIRNTLLDHTLQQENDFHADSNERKHVKSQEQIIPSNTQMGKRDKWTSSPRRSRLILFFRSLDMIDDADTYIVRDVLTDDIIFITPEDALNSTSNGYDMLYDNEVKSSTENSLEKYDRFFFSSSS